ncbi:MAG: hypothetical protein ACRCZO_17485 [Cetobacterium sp.]
MEMEREREMEMEMEAVVKVEPGEHYFSEVKGKFTWGDDTAHKHHTRVKCLQQSLILEQIYSTL